MFFSIVIPVYNVEKYLRECVDSLIQQSFKDYEIILIDDGSTDGSSKVCDELSEEDLRIKVIHKVNGGSSAARNMGTDYATGEYVVYLDSDDFVIEEDFLQSLYESALNKPDIITYKFAKYYEKNNHKANCTFSYRNISEGDSYSEIIEKMVYADSFYGMAWIKALRREFLVENHISFQEGLLGEDMDWNYYVMYYAKAMKVIDREFIAYRQRLGSATSNYKLKNLTDYIYILDKWATEISKMQDEKLKYALLGSLAKHYSNMLIVYTRVKDSGKTKSVKQIKKLKWLLQYARSKRPILIRKMYGVFGFNITISALKIADKIK